MIKRITTDRTKISKHVFLSTSIPSKKMDLEITRGGNLGDIREILCEIIQIILLNNSAIICGGHPSITPIMLSIVRNLKGKLSSNLQPMIYIYQSRFFQDQVPLETIQIEKEGIGRIIWTPAGETLEESLIIMRDRMLSEMRIDAAIFIGGMDGVKIEYEMFKQYYPDQPCYIIVFVGGASRNILKELKKKLGRDKKEIPQENGFHSSMDVVDLNVLEKPESTREHVKKIWTHLSERELIKGR
ncbi:MAG: hypothetical protein ACTSRA_11170 [Promethearchaeota archaeon]